MATIDTARNLYNAACNGSSAVNGRSQADVAAYGRCIATLFQAIQNYNVVNPAPFVPISPAIFKPNGGFPGQPGTLWGDYVAVVTTALASANSTCTAAGASGPVAFPTTAAALPTMLTAIQARIAAALALQTASPSMTAALNATLTAMNLAYGTPPAQNDATALAALQTAANTALATAVTDATALCTAYGINPTGGGN